MKRHLKRVIAIILSLSILCSTLLSTGLLSASAANKTTLYNGTMLVKEASKYLGAKYVFGQKGYSNPYGSSTGGTKFAIKNVKKSYGIDCSGLVYASLNNLGVSTKGFAKNNPVPVDTADWLYSSSGARLKEGDKVTFARKGKSEEVTLADTVKVTSKDRDKVKKAYEDMCASAGAGITGAIVVYDNLEGTNHAWILIGKATNTSELKELLKGCGIDYNDVKSYIKDLGSDGCDYWRIESTTGQGVVINNGFSGKGTYFNGIFEIFKEEDDTASVSLTKHAASPTASADEKEMRNVSFTLSADVKVNGLPREEATDIDGCVSWDDLPVYKTDGSKINYTITENGVANGAHGTYVARDNGYSQTFTLEEGKTFTPSNNGTTKWVNEHKRGDYYIHKTIDSANYAGVTFQLIGSAIFPNCDIAENINLSGTTDANGNLYFVNIPVGTYTLIEAATPNAGVSGISSKQITITWDGQYNYPVRNAVNNDGAYYEGVVAVDEIKNYKQRGDVRVRKEVDQVNDNGQVTGATVSGGNADKANSAEGFVFALTGTSDFGTPVYLESTTLADGYAYFNNVELGNYTISEITSGNQRLLDGGNGRAVRVNADGDTGENYAAQGFNLVNTTNGFGPNGQTFASTFINRAKKWKAVLYKHDFESKEVPQGDATLAGATYELHRVYGGNDRVVATYTTQYDAALNQYVLNIPEYTVFGSYYLKEISAPVGYHLNEETYWIYRDDNNDGVECASWTDVQTFTIATKNDGVASQLMDKVKKAPITVIKILDYENSDSGKKDYEVGAEFQVWLKSAGSYETAKETERDTITTGEDGVATTKKLPYGTYVVHQTKSSDEDLYELSADYEVFIYEDSDLLPATAYTNVVNNKVPSATLKVVKKLEDGTTIPIANTRFKLYNADTGEQIKFTVPNAQSVVETIEEFVTNNEGIMYTPLPLSAGRYQIEEIEPPFGTKLTLGKIDFKITPKDINKEADENGILKTVVYNFENKPQKQRISVEKYGDIFKTVSESDGFTRPVFEEGYLDGVEFDIIANEDIITPDGTVRHRKGDVVGTLTTDVDGKALSELLYLGEYAVVETKAPHGYVLDSTPHIVKLEYDKARAMEGLDAKDLNIEIRNTRQNANITAKKHMEVNEKFKIGKNGEVKNVLFGLYAAEEMTATDGKVIAADSLIDSQYCDDEGNLSFTTDIPCDYKYYVKEISTDYHYLLDTTEYEVEFLITNDTDEIIELKVNDGEPIENKIALTNIVGTKKDEDGNLVKDAEYGLFDREATEFTKDTAIITAKTDETGKFVMEFVPVGNYILREIEVPAPYAVSEEAVAVTVTGKEEEIKVDLVDKFRRGNIEVFKYDADYPENKLSGAEFTVYTDTNENGVYDEGDTEYGKLTEDEAGHYIIKDLRYGRYLVKETAAPEYFLVDENYYPVFIEEDGKTYAVTNNGECFIDQAQKGGLKLIKTSSEGEVEGFTFNIKGTSLTGHEVDITETTNADGEINIENLRVGTYTVTEIATPLTEKYVLPEPQEVTINANEIATVDFFNKIIEGKIVITKTDVATGDVIEGATIEILDEDMNVLFTGVTSKKGKVEFTLPYGKYYFRESKAPNGYILDETPHAFEITEDGQIIKATMTNKAMTPPVKTGDQHHIYGAIAGFMATISALGMVFLSSRKRKETEAK